MAQTTFEEAKLCPQCKQPGQDRKTDPLLDGKGTTIHYIYCVNDQCDWYNTPWLVQVNADGSIPPPTDHTASPKEYRGFEFDDEVAKRIIDQAMHTNELAQQPGGHNEINPHSR